ncbi:YbhB/YbcL family Raf kinase inhibitor-like protein [Diaphorobacter ruginosibacter]|uniref:YbhB/YbcL family Raf kinase inhibitor-like protein n=1 Tax=Diaphorobacter ruginosibacter TaxID=1715720 RepID=UPI0033413F51
MATEFSLSSPDIPAGGSADPRFEFNGFGCSGQNQSPVLNWTAAPAGTRSFALTVYDPDAPTGSGWWHWFVVDIPADVTQLAAHAGEKGGARLPKGARHVRNDYGLYEFGGFCPPPGDKPHRYVFTLHALSVDRLEIPADATAALAGFMVNANTIAKVGFTSTYARAA